MKIIQSAATVLFVTLLSSPLSAATSDNVWTEISHSSNAKLFINTEDLKNKQDLGTLQVWSRYLLNSPRLDPNIDPMKKVGSYIEKVEIDCSKKTYTILEIMAYDESLNFIAKKVASRGKNHEMVPGTLAYDRFKTMCSTSTE